MAPEQLAGREVSVKSDLFALGPVLYEVFTGKRAFDAMAGSSSSAAAPADAHDGGPDLDPRSTGRSCAASRAIRPCVQRRPSRSRQAFQAPASRRRSRRDTITRDGRRRRDDWRALAKPRGRAGAGCGGLPDRSVGGSRPIVSAQSNAAFQDDADARRPGRADDSAARISARCGRGVRIR